MRHDLAILVTLHHATLWLVVVTALGAALLGRRSG